MYLCIHKYIHTYIYTSIHTYYNCMCGSVAKVSDTQAVGHGFDLRPDH